MKTRTIDPPLPTIRSPLIADTSYYDGYWNRQTHSISNNFNKSQSRKIITVRLQKSSPMHTRCINSFSYYLRVPILYLSKRVRLLKVIKNNYPWSIRILHKSISFFYSSQTPNKLNCRIDSFLRDMVSHYLLMHPVSTGHLLFRKAPKNPT